MSQTVCSRQLLPGTHHHLADARLVQDPSMLDQCQCRQLLLSCSIENTHAALCLRVYKVVAQSHMQIRSVQHLRHSACSPQPGSLTRGPATETIFSTLMPAQLMYHILVHQQQQVYDRMTRCVLYGHVPKAISPLPQHKTSLSHVQIVTI
jgi:hypothetical protein